MNYVRSATLAFHGAVHRGLEGTRRRSFPFDLTIPPRPGLEGAEGGGRTGPARGNAPRSPPYLAQVLPLPLQLIFSNFEVFQPKVCLFTRKVKLSESVLRQDTEVSFLFLWVFHQCEQKAPASGLGQPIVSPNALSLENVQQHEDRLWQRFISCLKRPVPGAAGAGGGHALPNPGAGSRKVYGSPSRVPRRWVGLEGEGGALNTPPEKAHLPEPPVPRSVHFGRGRKLGRSGKGLEGGTSRDGAGHSGPPGRARAWVEPAAGRGVSV